MGLPLSFGQALGPTRGRILLLEHRFPRLNLNETCPIPYKYAVWRARNDVHKRGRPLYVSVDLDVRSTHAKSLIWCASDVEPTRLLSGVLWPSTVLAFGQLGLSPAGEFYAIRNAGLARRRRGDHCPRPCGYVRKCRRRCGRARLKRARGPASARRRD